MQLALHLLLGEPATLHICPDLLLGAPASVQEAGYEGRKRVDHPPIDRVL
jgi:hypothetical protein